MISDVRFLKTGCSRSSGVYPIFKLDDDGNKKYTGYVQQSYSSVKVTEDLQQTLVLPSFDGWSKCDMVYIVGTGYFYWITAATRSSDNGGAVRFELLFCATTSLLDPSVTVEGDFSSIPGIRDYTNRVPSGSLTEVPMKQFELPGTETASDGRRIGWVSFTVSSTCNEYYLLKDDDITVQPGYYGTYPEIHYVDADKQGYTTYGFPIFLDEYRTPNVADHIKVQFTADKNGSSLESSLTYNGATYELYPVRDAPTIGDIMNHISNIGFTTDDIVDISVSTVIPFYHTLEEGYYFTGTASDPVQHTAQIFTLKKVTGYNSDGTPILADVQPLTHDRTSTLAFYKVQGYTGETGGEYTDFLTGNLPSYQTFEIKETVPDMATRCTLRISDYQGNYVAEIPNEYVRMTAVDNLVGAMTVYCDYNGMFRFIGISDNDGHTMTVVLSEPHLPYLGTQWETYKAYSLNDDRTALISNIGFSIANTAASVGVGAAGAAMAGNSIAQTIGIQNVQSGAGSVMGIAQQVYGQYMKERQIKHQPAQPVAIGYGINQLILSASLPPSITVFRAKDYSVDTVLEYLKKHGYPNTGVKEITATGGCFQGVVFSTSTDICGPLMDALNNEFIKGVIITELDTTASESTGNTGVKGSE